MIPETPDKQQTTPDCLVSPEVEVTILRNATIDLEVAIIGFQWFIDDLETEREGNAVYAD